MDESPLHPALADLLNAARAGGYEVIFTDEGGPETWGNRTAINAIAALKYRYSPDRPITLIGCSMGALALLNYVAVAPPASVTGAIDILPFSPSLPRRPPSAVVRRRHAATGRRCSKWSGEECGQPS